MWPKAKRESVFQGAQHGVSLSVSYASRSLALPARARSCDSFAIKTTLADHISRRTCTATNADVPGPGAYNVRANSPDAPYKRGGMFETAGRFIDEHGNEHEPGQSISAYLAVSTHC